MALKIVRGDLTDMQTDAIVNAANSGLYAGGGVCGAIFSRAGYDELTKACRSIGHCETGSAVITPGFALKAKYIIHAVGPVWSGGNSGEAKLLYGCYYRALELARENGIHSIGFPLISSGIFGYPKGEAWQIGLRACLDFIRKNTDFDIDIYFAVLSDEILRLGQSVLEEELERNR